MAKVLGVVLLLFSISTLAQSDSIGQQIQSMYDSRLERFQTAPTPEAMADAYVADIVDDAVWMPQGGAPVRGKTDVREWAVDFFATWILEITNSEFEPIIVGEDLAIRRWVTNGVYVERSTGRRIPFSQKYIDILEKQPDGTWKLESHMWSSNDRDPSIWVE
jgi:ketosteroid isomerase-like protein